MEPVDIALKYFDAWNKHDSAAIVALFAEGGTYNDPAVDPGLTGLAITDYINSLFAAFPDLSFEIVGTASGDGMAAVQWVMRGTNTGPFAGSPPTGRSVALPGADFITVVGDKICSVQVYFDQKTFVEQLGLRVTVIRVFMSQDSL